MQPAIEWFWRSSQEYFQHELPFEVLVSSLRPPHPITQSAQLATKRILGFHEAKPLLLLLCLFFCAGYIPMLFLAEQSSSQVLDSLVTKPIGVAGWGKSVVLFHGLLTLAVVAPILFAFQWLTAGMWMAIALGFAAYMGVAFVIGCGCRSVPSASSALIVYGVLSGIAMAAAFWRGLPPGALSLEARLFELFASDSANIHSLLTLALWAVAWAALGTLMFRRVRLRYAS